MIDEEVMAAYRVRVEALNTRQGGRQEQPPANPIPTRELTDSAEEVSDVTHVDVRSIAVAGSVITGEYALSAIDDEVETPHHASNVDESYDEGNHNLLYLELGILPWEEAPSQCTGRVIANVDNGAALSLIDKEVYEALKMSDSLNTDAQVIIAVGLLNSTPQEMNNRVDFNARVRTVQGHLVKIRIRARVTSDLGVPILIGSPCLKTNDMDIHMRSMQVSIGVGNTRVFCNAICRCQGISSDKGLRSLRLQQDQGLRTASIRRALITRCKPKGTGEKAALEQDNPAAGEEILKQCAIRGIIQTEAIQATLVKWAVEEEEDLRAYALLCSGAHASARPSLFPEEYWSKVRDECKVRVQSIWGRYSTERLLEIIPEVMTMDISKEDAQRRLEEPYVRAQLLANIHVYFDVDKEDAPKMKGHVYTFEMVEGDMGQPIKLQSQRFNANERAFLQAKMSIMVKQGRVVRRAGPNNNPLMLVPYQERIKATHDKWSQAGVDPRIALVSKEYEKEIATWYRLTIDLRALNKRTQPMRYPIPRIDDCLANKESGRWTAGDVMDAFYTLEADEAATRWQGFTTHEGHYEMRVMAQGAMNAAMFWASVISVTFEPICQGDQEDIIVYQDDVFNTINNFLKHMVMNETVGECLTNSGLRIKCTKYHGNYRQMKVLGHVMTRMGRYSDPELVRAITDIGDPSTQGEVRSILGLAIVAREYVHELAEILSPLQDLVKKGVSVTATWKDEIHGAALRRIKRILTSRPVLLNIRLDKKFRVHVDACRRGRGIGAVILQQNEHNDDQWQPVAYWSFKLTSAEREYSATDLECKGMHDSILHWSCYLTNGITFDVVTDHYALVYLISKPAKDSNGRIMRYIMDIQGYNFGIIHRKGQLHIDADTVSRLLRYDDSLLRILTKEQLQEEGVVTVKDQEDIMWNEGLVLPYPGIDRKTKEQLLDDLESNRNQWGDEEKKLITMITLRHELEKLVGMKDDSRTFVDQMEEQHILEEEDLVVRATECVCWVRQLKFARAKHILFRDEEKPNGLRNSIEESELLNDEPAWKRYDTMGSGCELYSPEQRREHFKKRRQVRVQQQHAERQREAGGNPFLAITADILARQKEYEEQLESESPNEEDEEAEILRLLTLTQTRINGREYSKVTRRAVSELCKVYGTKIDESMINSNNNDEGDTIAVVSGIQTRSNAKTKKGLQVTSEESQPISDPWVEDERHYDELADITEEQEAIVFENQYLSGRQYVDDDDGRLYEVLEVFWSKEFGELLAYRLVRDGAPPSEHDDAPFKVLDGERNIRALVEKYERKHPFEEIVELSEELVRAEQMNSPDMKRIWDKIDQVDYQDGVKMVKLKKRTYVDRKGLAIREQRTVNTRNSLMTIIQRVEPIVLPRRWRKHVLNQFHREAGHTGAARLKQTLIKKYVWPSMGVDIVDHCRGCMHCQKRNVSTTIVQEPPLLVYPRLSRPFQRCHIDLFGPLPRTRNGYVYVLVFKCALTKWTEQFALKSKSAEDVAECFIDEIVLRHGAPKMLVSDAGKEFINYHLKAICKMLKVRKVTTSPYNPRADGLAENQVKTTKDMLSSYCNAFQDDWDKYLAVVSHYYRTTYNDAIGMTPFYAMYGRECEEIKTAWISEVVEENKDLPEYVKGLSSSLIEVWESLGLTVFENGMNMQRQHQKKVKTKLHEYVVGDLVMVRKIPSRFFVSEDKVDGKTVKMKLRRALQDKYRGPFKVLKVVNPLTFVIRIGAKGRGENIAYKNMKPYVVDKSGYDTEDEEEEVLESITNLWN